MSWLAEPGRSSLLPFLIAAAVIFATFAIQDGSRSGLRILAMLTVTFALEIDQSAGPLLWVMLFSAIPAAIAMAFALYQYRNPDSDKDEFFWPNRVLNDYLFSVIGVFLLPIVAPVVLAIGLVTSYKVKVSEHPSKELISEVLRRLEENPVKLSEVDAQTALGALAAILTSVPSQRASRDLAWYYTFSLKHAIGARTVRLRE